MNDGWMGMDIDWGTRTHICVYVYVLLTQPVMSSCCRVLSDGLPTNHYRIHAIYKLVKIPGLPLLIGQFHWLFTVFGNKPSVWKNKSQACNTHLALSKRNTTIWRMEARDHNYHSHLYYSNVVLDLLHFFGTSFLVSHRLHVPPTWRGCWFAKCQFAFAYIVGFKTKLPYTLYLYPCTLFSSMMALLFLPPREQVLAVQGGQPGAWLPSGADGLWPGHPIWQDGCSHLVGALRLHLLLSRRLVMQQSAVRQHRIQALPFPTNYYQLSTNLFKEVSMVLKVWIL